jgi:hypothetical protein
MRGLVALVCALAAAVVHDLYTRTFAWLSMDLLPPQEVAAWGEAERFDRLFRVRLSRWGGFLSVVQFNRFVCDQIAPLGLNRTVR